MATQKQAKESIAGGCLCGKQIPFPNQLVLSWVAVTIRYASWPIQRVFILCQGSSRLCAECGAVLSWRGDDVPEEIDIFPGTVDEAFLIGDRTARVDSKVLKEKRMWEQVLRKEERGSKIDK